MHQRGSSASAWNFADNKKFTVIEINKSWNCYFSCFIFQFAKLWRIMGRFVYWVEANGYFMTFNWLEAGYLGWRGFVLRMKDHIIYTRHSNAV